MTPTSLAPLQKVTNGAIAAAIAAIVLALIKRYVWTDLPADLEGPLNTIVLALVVAGASGVTGWLTKLQPGEITPIDAVLIDAQPSFPPPMPPPSEE